MSGKYNVVTVLFVPRSAVTKPCCDHAFSKHSDWFVNDFARCDWLNRTSSIPYRDRNSVP